LKEERKAQGTVSRERTFGEGRKEETVKGEKFSAEKGRRGWKTC
jgi:hypothetical protein